MNLEQAAEQLGCSVKTVRRRIQTGELRAARVARGIWVIRDEDLDAYLDAAVVAPRPAQAVRIDPSPVVPRTAGRRQRPVRGDGRLTVPPRERRAA